MIGIDWGTSSFRAYRLGADGRVVARSAAPLGIMAVQDGAFDAALREAIGEWFAEGERRVLLCGMIGSRQGWVEAPYLDCPAGPADLADALVPVPFDKAEVRLVPGLTARDPAGIPEVMRGEETQIAGALDRIEESGVVCLPGTHAKWVRLEGRRIAGFATYLTGEAFAALRDHTILGRMMRAGAADSAAFERGVLRSAEAGGLLHHLFGVRTLGLAGVLAEAEAASYLSGVLIGHEVREALADVPHSRVIPVIGAPELAAQYSRAIVACGGEPKPIKGEPAARGLALIGELASWS